MSTHRHVNTRPSAPLKVAPRRSWKRRTHILEVSFVSTTSTLKNLSSSRDRGISFNAGLVLANALSTRACNSAVTRSALLLLVGLEEAVAGMLLLLPTGVLAAGDFST